MFTYRYTAIDARGRRKRGRLTATNPDELESRLARMDMDLISCRTVRARRSRCRLPRHELINLTFQLRQLIAAGVPLVAGLRDLGDSVGHPRLREVVAQLVIAIEGGRTFSMALAGYPELFDRTFVAVVRVGEETGRLDEVLAHLSAMYRWQDELAARARRVMVYPAVVGVVVLLTVVTLLAVLVPQLLAFVAGTGGELPWYTRALIVASRFCVQWWAVMLAAPVLAVLLVVLASRASPSLGLLADRVKLRVWILGPLLHRIKLARFTHCFALMYAAGIGVLDAINLSRGVVDNRALEQALVHVHARISDGEGLAESFAHSRLFPALVVRMVRVGETTGAMDEALHNASTFFDRQVNDAIDVLIPLVGPLLIAFIATLLGWIMLSVLGPVYDAVLNLAAL